MKVIRACAATLALLFAVATGATAQEDDPSIQVDEENTGIGTRSGEFLLLGAGARGMALGPAFAAVSRDAEGLYYNPAVLPLMEGPEAMITSMPYHADTDYRWAGFALPLGGQQYGFGISIGNFGFSDQPVYTADDRDNESQVTYDVAETVIGLSLGYAFIDRFSGGMTVKFISDQLGQTSATGFAVDVGTNYHAELGGRPISMSVVLQNLGTELQHDGSGLDISAFFPGDDAQGVDPSEAEFQTQSSPLPAAFRFGVAYDAVSTPANRVTLAAEFNEADNTDPGGGFAAEYEFSPPETGLAAALRGSYAWQPDNNISEVDRDRFGPGVGAGDDSGMDGIVVGGGIAYDIAGYEARVDYAYRHFGVLGSVNVFTLGFGWR